MVFLRQCSLGIGHQRRFCFITRVARKELTVCYHRYCYQPVSIVLLAKLLRRVGDPLLLIRTEADPEDKALTDFNGLAMTWLVRDLGRAFHIASVELEPFELVPPNTFERSKPT